jgi:hypothetical protein
MENNFDLKKFLVENKLTNNSRLLEVDTEDSELDAAMKAGLSALSSGGDSLDEITEEEQPKELNESVVALIGSGLLAAPKIIEWIAKAIGAISRFYSIKDNPEDPAFVKKIVHFTHKWEHLYIKTIIWVVKKTNFLKKLWITGDGKIDEQKLLVLAKYIYAAILATAIGNAVGTVLGPGSTLLKGIEGALGGVKAVEIVQIAAKVKGQLKPV